MAVTVVAQGHLVLVLVLVLAGLQATLTVVTAIAAVPAMGLPADRAWVADQTMAMATTDISLVGVIMTHARLLV